MPEITDTLAIQQQVEVGLLWPFQEQIRSLFENDTTAHQYINAEDIPATASDYPVEALISSIVVKPFGITSLEHQLRSAFSDMPAVEAIYTENFPGKVEITILISGEQYNETLMDELLDIEYNIHNDIPDIFLSFRYLPQLNRKPEECISPSARLVFKAF